jgi:hypothetical protein
VSKGPLAVEWGAPPAPSPEAGAVEVVQVELANAGSIAWRDTIFVSYHWLDLRDNPIDWDGIRTPAPQLAPGHRGVVDVRIRAPIPPGRYRLAFDLVAELRAWFSELGGDELRTSVDVEPRDDPTRAELPAWVEKGAGWDERVAATHAEGYAVVAGAIAWDGGLLHPRPRALAPYEPGPGRVPGFPHPLVCPSVVEGLALERLDDVAGLPAYAAPAEPWMYDGRVVLRARARSGRRSA